MTGVTSASIYRSPTDRLYVFCTTAPSSVRSSHQGEWSFVVPLPNLNLPRIRPPNNNSIHNFEQFKFHCALRAGCVSSRHNIIAVLEETGKISILPLEAHEKAGIHGSDDDALAVLPEVLCKQDNPSPSCLHFDPTGERLFAIDPKGKIIIAEFEEVE